jgi:PAS domain S-box-containing protein
MNRGKVPSLGRLAVVDDESELMEALADAIKGLGYDVSGFSTGAAAIAALKVSDFDVLLTDLLMPGMSGIECFQQAREIDPHVVGIIMTGHATIHTAIEAMKVGVFDYVLKPFKLDELMPLLDRAITVRRLGLENLQLRQTVAMYELGQTVSYSLALETILDKVADGALQQCQADETSIMLPSEDRGELYIAAIRGKDRAALLGKRVPMDRHVAGWVAGHREHLVLDGEVRDARFTPVNPRRDIELAVSLPLLVGGALVGVLNLNFTHARRPLTVGEVKALNIFGSIAATALESSRLHAKLLAAEHKYRGIFEDTSEGIFQTTPDGKCFMTANPAMARILGFDSAWDLTGSISDIGAQVLGKPGSRVDLLEKLEKNRPIRNLECACTRRDGTEIWVLLSAQRSGRPDEGFGCEGSMVDISDFKRAQEEIRALSRFPEENPNPVMRLSREGILLYANQASRPILEAWKCARGRKVPEEYNELARAALASGTPVGAELTAESRTFSAVFAPVKEAGYVNVYSLDRTEERNLQQQLLQAQKIDAIGRLAGGIAHDFNNVLTAIIGYSDFLLMKLGKENPLGREVREIRKAGERAASLTQQLLAFSRKQIFEVRVLNLNAIISGMEKMLQRLIHENISLDLALDPALGQVRADSSQMEQILLNLVINASDAMPDGGKLLVETSNTELDASYSSMHMSVKPGPHVVLIVSDTGIGMSEETRDRVFEPFFTTKERGKGTGLGLSTVYGIVKQSGGNIWVYSEPGKGTAIKIYLPRVSEAVEEVPKESPGEELGKGTETILVIEDEVMIREIINVELVEQGFTVLLASDGEEALGICAGHKGPIQLLLTDVILPGMSGREAAKSITSSRPEIRVIYMSGYTANGIVHHGVLAPGIAFIQKPFSPAQLLDKIRLVLDAQKPPAI